MSRYHIAKGLAERLLPGVRESLSQALSRLAPEDQAGLAETLAKAIREAVESHRREADRRRRVRDMMRQYDRNTREVGASRGRPRRRARLLVESAVEAWHGTRNLDFGTFSRAFTSGQLGFHFGTEEQATGLLGEGEAVPRVIRVELDIENPLRMPDLGGWTGHAAKAEFERALGVSIPGSGSDASIVRAIRAAGHDGVVYANRFEGEGDSYIAFDPSQIRIVGDARAPRSMKSLSARTRGGGEG